MVHPTGTCEDSWPPASTGGGHEADTGSASTGQWALAETHRGRLAASPGANRKKGNPASGLGPSTYRDGLKAAETQKDQELGATAFNRSKPMPGEEEEDVEASVDPVANISAS